MTRERERTAAEIYAERRKSIDARLVRLRAVLRVFDRWHRETPTDWSVVGDTKVVDTALDQILAGCEAAETWIKEGWGKNGGGR